MKQGCPAFPVVLINTSSKEMSEGEYTVPPFTKIYFPGMSLRSYFAGQALSGIAATQYADKTWATLGYEQDAAALSVRLADALIAELAKPCNAKVEGGEG